MARLIKIRVFRGAARFFSDRWRKSDIGDTDTVKYCALLARITPVFAFFFFTFSSSFSSPWNFRSFLE